MTGSNIANRQLWCDALRGLLGFSSYALSSRQTTVCASSPRDLLDAMQIASLVHDAIHVIFDSDEVDAEPASVAIAVRRDGAPLWLPSCRLYAASHWSPVELLTMDERWLVSPRDSLASAALPRPKLRAKGSELAMGRWRRMVAKAIAAKLTNAGQLNIAA